MTKTARIAFGVAALLVASIAIAIFWTLSHLDSIVKSTIETVGLSVTGAQVRVASVHISLQDGTGEINGLTIGNPAGFDSDYALRFGKVYLSLDKASVTTDVVRIKAIGVEDTIIIAEVKAGSGINLQKIMDNMNSDDPKEQASDTGDAGTRLIIDRFDLTQSEVSLVTGVKNYQATMGDVHVTGIGQETNGVSAREVALQLLRPMIREAIKTAKKEGSKHGVDELRESVTDKLKGKLGIGG